MTRTVFLDRDGTLNEKAADGDYIKHPGELQMLPGAVVAVARLNRAGLKVVLVSNQRGIALGRMTAADVDAVNAALAAELAVAGAHVDAFFICPHDYGECDCRKPGIGMFLQAREADPAIDFSRSVMVGDSESDIQAGKAAGIATVSVGGEPYGADHHAPDITAAVEWILA